MPNDGQTREYNWEDILCLILVDMDLEPTDRQHHDLWYYHGFMPPKEPKDKCIVVTKYASDYRARLEENARDKV